MDSTQVRQPAAVPALFGVGAIVLGLVAAPVAGWLVDLLERTPIPVQGLLQVVAGLPLAWSLPVGLVLGVVAGAGLARAIVHEGLTLTVDSDGIEHEQKGRDGWLDHMDVASVHREGRYAVVLDHQGGVLARQDADSIGTERLRAALTQHGYRYLEADYRRWQDGRPGLSSTEHRPVRRWRAAKKGTTERSEARLVVRERDGRIRVRRTAGARRGAYRRPAAA